MSTATKNLIRREESAFEEEQALIGSVLLMPTVFDEVESVVSPDDFGDETLKTIYRAAREIFIDGKRLDLVTLQSRMKARKEWNKDVAATIAKCGTAVPHAGHARWYAETVRFHGVRRELMVASMETLKELNEPSDGDSRDVDQLIAGAESRIYQIADKASRGSRIHNSMDLFRDALDEIDRRIRGEGDDLVPSGIRPLDDIIIGFERGGLIVIGARPGVGKTSFALELALRAALEDQSVLFVSMEMLVLELADRILSSLAQVNLHRMKNGLLSNNERAEIVNASEKASQLPLHVDDSPYRSISDIAASARQMRRKQGLDLLVVDYLQLIEPENPRDRREEQISKITRRLKGLARELDVPVVVLSQLNREGDESERPSLKHLRESGAIEQDTNQLIFLWLPAEKDDRKSLRHATVAKNRNGRIGDFDLGWQGEYTRFIELESKPTIQFADRRKSAAGPQRYAAFDEFDGTI